jgi:hypothetical protein
LCFCCAIQVDVALQDFMTTLKTRALAPYVGGLSFGHLTAAISLHPALRRPGARHADVGLTTLPAKLEIACFLPVSVLQNPPCSARYVVVGAPLVSTTAAVVGAEVADFRVLLHDTLRRENSAAVVSLGSPQEQRTARLVCVG